MLNRLNWHTAKYAQEHALQLNGDLSTTSRPNNYRGPVSTCPRRVNPQVTVPLINPSIAAGIPPKAVMDSTGLPR